MNKHGEKDTITWPELYLVLENAELAAHREVRAASERGGASEKELWQTVDKAATHAARHSLGGARELSPPKLRLVIDAAEVANLDVR